VQPTRTVWCETALEWHTALSPHPPFFSYHIPNRSGYMHSFTVQWYLWIQECETCELCFLINRPSRQVSFYGFRIFYILCRRNEWDGWMCFDALEEWQCAAGAQCVLRSGLWKSSDDTVTRSLMIPISLVACHTCTPSYATNCDRCSL